MRTAPFLFATALLGVPAGAASQRLLELPARTGAEPDALTTGAAAAFWNPAGVATLGGRGEAIVVDVNGPDATGLGGFAGAGAMRLDPRTVVAVHYRHAGVEDMDRTSTSPAPDAEALDVSEDLFGLAAARTVHPSLDVGAGIEYARPSAEMGTDSKLVLGAGARLRLGGSLGPTVAGVAQAEEGEAGWRAALELAPEALRRGDWTAALAYGIAGGPRLRGEEHRVAARVAWQERVTLSGGIAAGADDDGTSLTLVGGALVSIRRYTVGVVREQLAHGFGAVHSLRFGVRF